MRAKDIMTVNIVTVSGETSAKHASQAVAENVRGAVGVQNHIRVMPAHGDMREEALTAE